MQILIHLRGVSIHSLRKKGDILKYFLYTFMICFNPLPSQEGRRNLLSILNYQCSVSIHSLRKKGDVADTITHEASNVSIHSLRKKGDNHP